MTAQRLSSLIESKSKVCIQILCILSSFFLSSCTWLPWTQPQTADGDLIYRLLYDLPDDKQRPKGQPNLRSRTDKQLTLAPRLPKRSGSLHLALNTAQRCFLFTGIPSETLQRADPSNYDRRVFLDFNKKPVENVPKIIVLHETVVSEADTLMLFRTPHKDEHAQASYHMIIPEDGRRVRIVPDDKRAYGAGNSAFHNFTIRLKPYSPGSINNIALHLSLVSPPDGRGEAATHSGYTTSQYRSAAAQVLLWQLAYGIPLTHLTTHKDVDLSQARKDPRSFDWGRFLSSYTRLSSDCGLQSETGKR